VLVAAGTRGIAPLRAALAWTPVQAHAGTHGVSLFYAAASPAAAAYLPEWEEWRDAGVKVHIMYTGEDSNGSGDAGREAGASGGSHEALQQALEVALFGGERGFVGALGGGDPGEAAVAMCGLPGDVAAHLTRRFTRAGVASERLLFCDYF
jgi:ferredoxin-NADP reductase